MRTVEFCIFRRFKIRLRYEDDRNIQFSTSNKKFFDYCFKIFTAHNISDHIVKNY